MSLIKNGKLPKGMKRDAIFVATDKLGRKYKYRFVGKAKVNNGYDIQVFNMTTCSTSFVEEEWFNQRKIELVAE